MIATVRHLSRQGLAVTLAAIGTIVLGSCAVPRAPTTRPLPSPPPSPPPMAIPAPLPGPNSNPADWRDAPQTAGDWRWALDGGRSAASFAAAGSPAMVRLICDRNASRVLLMRAGQAAGAVPMAVQTTSSERALSSNAALSPPGWVAAGIAVRDPLLDAMAFSRGRFALETAGLETLYLPAWPEISRVIEDCR